MSRDPITLFLLSNLLISMEKFTQNASSTDLVLPFCFGPQIQAHFQILRILFEPGSRQFPLPQSGKQLTTLNKLTQNTK